MGCCDTCLKSFPALNRTTCGRCLEVYESGASQLVRDILLKMPQCPECGVPDPLITLNRTMCSLCSSRMASKAGKESNALVHSQPGHSGSNSSIATAERVRYSAIQHMAQASRYRLNQLPRTQNQNLLKTNIAQARIALYKQRGKPETLRVGVEVWIYPHGGNSAKKTQILPWSNDFSMNTRTEEMINTILTQAHEKYITCPRYAEFDVPKFVRSNIKLGVLVQSKPVELPEEILVDTVHAFYSQVKSRGWLPDRCIKTSAVLLRLYVYEEYMDYRSEGSENVQDEAGEVKALYKASKRRLPSYASVPPKRATYSSSYQPRDESIITYDSFSFVRVSFDVDSSGNVAMICGPDPDPAKVLVAVGWEKHFKGGISNKEGYIGKGWTKVAVRGRLGSNEVAVLQLHSGGSDEAQREALAAEARVLALVQYFLKSFNKRAKFHNVKKLPVISCNTAFLGQLTDGAKILSKAEGYGQRSLISRSFLVAPILPIGKAEELKFSGNSDFSPNTDRMGQAMDAFTHHTFIDSGETFLPADLQGFKTSEDSLILFDPQGHSYRKLYGPSDAGPLAFNAFRSEHVCNSFCRALKLGKLRVAQEGKKELFVD